MDVLNEILVHSEYRHASDISTGSDVVFVRKQQIEARVGADAWGREKSQIIKVSVRVYRSIEEAGRADDIAHTLDYRKIQKAIAQSNHQTYLSPWQYAQSLTMELHELVDRSYVEIDLDLPKAILQSEGIFVRYQHLKGAHVNKALVVRNMTIPCIIGIGAHERIQKQPVIVDFAVDGEVKILEDQGVAAAFRSVFDTFAKSDFLTLEAFVTAIARHLIVICGFNRAAVSAHKPAVFGTAEGPGVQIYRTRQFFEKQSQIA